MAKREERFSLSGSLSPSSPPMTAPPLPLGALPPFFLRVDFFRLPAPLGTRGGAGSPVRLGSRADHGILSCIARTCASPVSTTRAVAEAVLLSNLLSRAMRGMRVGDTSWPNSPGPGLVRRGRTEPTRRNSLEDDRLLASALVSDQSPDCRDSFSTLMCAARTSRERGLVDT